VSINKFLKYVKYVNIDDGVFEKNSQTTAKCDVERNWS